MTTQAVMAPTVTAPDANPAGSRDDKVDKQGVNLPSFHRIALFTGTGERVKTGVKTLWITFPLLVENVIYERYVELYFTVSGTYEAC